MATQKSPAKVEQAEIVVPTFDMLAGQATQDELGGASLTDKRTLLGVEMIVTRLVFRQSNIKRPDGSTAPEYVSVEALTRELGTVVFNDGSTGIRRQAINLLVKRGMLLTGTDFEADSSLADQVQAGNVEPAGNLSVLFDNTGGMVLDTFDLAPPVRVRNGLRVSEYDGPTGPASTYYFA